MALFQVKGKTLKPLAEKAFDLEKHLQVLTEQNLEAIFGLQFISGKLNRQLTIHGFEIDTLAFDPEIKSFVIIEYKKDQNFSVIDQGYNYLGLMLNNKADFILEYNERLRANFKKNDIDWSQSRVIFISPAFTSHQRGAIAFKDLPIELWEVKLYDQKLVLYNKIEAQKSAESIQKISKNKTVSDVSREIKVYTLDDHLKKASNEIRQIFNRMREEIINWNSKVEEKALSWYVGYKIGSYNFVIVSFYKNKLRIHIRKDQINDPRKRFKMVPEKYGWGKTKIWLTDITTNEDMHYAIKIIREGYNYWVEKAK